jgi:ABC-2 type transport system permease protein
VFIQVNTLPPVWQVASHLNPFFYLVDGFRYGFFGIADVSPAASAAVVSGCVLGLTAVNLRLLAVGYKLRH